MRKQAFIRFLAAAGIVLLTLWLSLGLLGAAHATQIYGQVQSADDLSIIYKQIRADVRDAGTAEELRRLYRRAGYLATLTYSRTWEKKFSDDIYAMRGTAFVEFEATARAINDKLCALGFSRSYDALWGQGPIGTPE